MPPSPKSSETELSNILRDINKGIIQLPEFQRSWRWDDNRIRELLASLIQGFPIGAIMLLECGNADIQFKNRPLEGVQTTNDSPRYLVLDGQQRLTSFYSAIFSELPVITTNDKGKKLERYYYLSINDCLNGNIDSEEAIRSIPSDRKLKANFDRDILLDLSDPQKEYANEMFPINIVFSNHAQFVWADGYRRYFGFNEEHMNKINLFFGNILSLINSYKLPVITLDNQTPREAVCKVFENVNTGGVSLTVFELITASFATNQFDLRDDWRKCKDRIKNIGRENHSDLFDDIDESAFLSTITLYSSFIRSRENGTPISCKKKDVLAISFDDYKRNKDVVLRGFDMARKFLLQQNIFRKRDLPYATQIIPLVAICAYIGTSKFHEVQTQRILTRWLWCGILGEMYGGANETRYANDIEDIVTMIEGTNEQSKTINSAYFSSTRLLSLQTRNSAAYKGIMALIYRNGCKDFYHGTLMTLIDSINDNPDIHHIFPEKYCNSQQISKEKWKSIVNKTPITFTTNRSIQGPSPSKYIEIIKRETQFSDVQISDIMKSHLIDYNSLINDDFNSFFLHRASEMLKIIEAAMGKPVSDKGSEETIQAFGQFLE